MGNPREAARILLIDQSDQLLLLRGRDPSKPEAGSWWYAPGGGLEVGESHEMGAIRELWEETGHRAEQLGEPIWEREVHFHFNGVDYHQRELYYLVRVANFKPNPGAFSELEKDAIVEFKWWSAQEIRATDAIIHPIAIRERIDELISGRVSALAKLLE